MSDSETDPQMETKLISVIGDELMELDSDFGATDDLFEAGLDSMTIMQLLLVIEENFGVEIPAAELSRENFSTPRSIVSLIRGKQMAAS